MAKASPSPKKKAPAKKPVPAPKKTPAKKAASTKKPAVKKSLPRKKKSPQNSSGKHTIAQRKVFFRDEKVIRVLRWLPVLPLLGLMALFTFFMAGYSFTVLVCGVLIGIISFYNLADLLRDRWPKPVKAVRRIVTVILCIGILIVGVTEALIIKASFGDPAEHCAYVLVLGAKVRPDGPSVSLMNRIDAAYDYLTAHPDSIAIVSGGKGADEPMTEAKCMYDHLIARGIDPDRVWMENKATSTWENMNFTLALIEARTGQRPEKIGLISSEYHLYRAGLFARDCGVESVGIPAHTTRLSQMINHFMREVAGVWHYLILGGQYE